MTKQRAKRRPLLHRGVRILQLADGRTVARWKDPLGGAQRQQSLDALGLTTKDARASWAAAKAGELRALRRAAALGAVEARREDVAASIASYLESVAHEPTRINKAPPLREFAAWAAESRLPTLADLTGPRLMRWRDHVLSPQRSKHAPSTRSRWLITSGIFLRWAMRRGLCPRLNSDTIGAACRRAPVPRDPIEILRQPHLRLFLQACLAHDQNPRRRRKVAACALALLLSGCRLAEILDLQWSEVDLQAGEIRLPAARTKTRTGRTIAFRETPSLGALLAVMRQRAGGDQAKGRVFYWLNVRTWQTSLITAAKGAPGVEMSTHTLRRTCGSFLTCAPGIYGGASAFLSAKRLGHAVEMAERCYVGLLRDLPADARTLEAAAGIEDLAAAIVEAQRALVVLQ